MLIALTCAAPLLLWNPVGATPHGDAGDLAASGRLAAATAGIGDGRADAGSTQRRGAGGAGTGGAVRAGAVRGDADGVQVVALQAEDKLALAADYWAPKGNDHAPGVVLLHDAGATRATLTELAEQLHKKGFAVLAVDLRGHGESKSQRVDFAAATPDEQKNLWALASRDVQAAALWLRQRPEVHSTNLNIVAIGSGVGLAARHAVRDENVRSLVLLRPCAEQFGFDVARDLQTLEGLPTFVVAPNEVRTEVGKLLGDLADHASVKVDFVRDAQGPLLDERRLPRTIANWVGDQALPKRGRS